MLPLPPPTFYLRSLMILLKEIFPDWLIPRLPHTVVRVVHCIKAPTEGANWGLNHVQFAIPCIMAWSRVYWRDSPFYFFFMPKYHLLHAIRSAYAQRGVPFFYFVPRFFIDQQCGPSCAPPALSILQFQTQSPIVTTVLTYFIDSS